jgi:protein disulfide-isomerase
MKTNTLAAILLAAMAATAAFAAKKAAPEKVPAKGAEAGKWTQDYDAAYAFAKEHGLPVMLKFTGSDWCGWCQLMEKTVFSTAEFAKWAEGRVMLVTLDYPRFTATVPDEYKKRNNDLAIQHRIQGFPTYVVTDAEGKELGQLGASRDASVAKFTKDFEALVGTMPEKVAATSAAQGGASEAEVDRWMQTHCTGAQRQAYATRLTDDERAEFPALISADRDATAALEALAQERRKMVADVQTELTTLARKDPDAAKARKEKAMEELKALDAAQAEKKSQIEADRKTKAARLAELLAKMR